MLISYHVPAGVRLAAIVEAMGSPRVMNVLTMHSLPPWTRCYACLNPAHVSVCAGFLQLAGFEGSLVCYPCNARVNSSDCTVTLPGRTRLCSTCQTSGAANKYGVSTHSSVSNGTSSLEGQAGEVLLWNHGAEGQSCTGWVRLAID